MNSLRQRGDFHDGMQESWFKFNKKGWALKPYSVYDNIRLKVIMHLPLKRRMRSGEAILAYRDVLLRTAPQVHYGCNRYRIDCSEQAVRKTHDVGIGAQIDPGERPAYSAESVGLVVLCYYHSASRKTEQFKLLNEAHRIQKLKARINILQPYSLHELWNSCQSENGVQDYRAKVQSSFCGHSGYVITEHKVISYSSKRRPANQDEWVTKFLRRK
jgi:hypothetical protein